MEHQGRALIGPPSAFTALVFKFVALLGKAHEALLTTSKDRTDPVAPDMPEHVVLMQFPSPSAIEGIREGWLHPVLLVPHPYSAVAEAMQAKPTHLRDVLRTLSASAVANLAIGSCPTARLVVEDPAKRTDDALREVVAALNLDIPEAAIAAALQACCAKEGLAASLAAALGTSGQAGELSADDQKIVAEALFPIVHFAFGHVGMPVNWSTLLLLDADNPGNTAPAVIDVTGPARNILYGPYLHLPPADYDAEIMIRFSHWLDDVPFVLGVYAKDCLAEVRLQPQRAGTYGGSFPISVGDPCEAIEIRLRSEKGAIEGDLSMLGLSFRLKDAATPLVVDQRGAAYTR